MGKIENHIQKSISILLFIIGLIICFVTIIPLIKFKFTFAYLLIATLFFCGLLIIFGSIANIKSNDKNFEFEEKHIAISKEKNNLTNEIKILFRWNVDAKLWHDFKILENRNRNVEYFFTLVGICILGTIILILDKSSDWKTAFLISLSIGIIYIVLKKIISNTYLKTKKNQTNINVCLFENGVVLNEKYYPFWNDNRKLTNVKSKNENGINYLEFEVVWKTRNGIASDEIRIPFNHIENNLIQNILYYYNSKIH